MNYWVPHGFEYGCVEFEVTAPPAVALVQNLVQTKRKKTTAIYQKNDAIWGRAICQK